MENYLKVKSLYLQTKTNNIQNGGGNIADNAYIVTYPWASNFLDWLLCKLRKNKIPFKNPNTGGDFSKTFIGKSKVGIEMDWKHFDTYDIDQFNKELEKYKCKVEYIKADNGYIIVQFCNLKKK